MPVDGIPDSARHSLCIRCKKWHERDEGRFVVAEATGPISGMRQMASTLADDDSAKRFMCFRCIKVRRYTKAGIILLFAVLVLIILLLERLGML